MRISDWSSDVCSSDLSRPVVLGRYAGASAPRTLRRGARGGGSRGQSDRGDHRQPERQSGAKRGVSIDPQGFDAGKKVTGRKRHILVDTLGLMLGLVVHAGNVPDRDGAENLLRRTPRRFDRNGVVEGKSG